MTPQLVDHAHTDSCAVIGCYLMQLRRKMNMFISGRSHCEQRLPLRRRPSVVRRDIIIIYAPSVQRSSVSVPVCMSNGAAALGYRHAGCLQLSHVRTADASADGHRSAASRSAIGGGILSRPPGRKLVRGHVAKFLRRR